MSHNIDNLDVLKRPKEFVKQAGFWDLYLLGITIVLGGQFFSWNAGLQGGFWEFFTSTVITGSAYICLVLCMAEMTSAMPFSGKLTKSDFRFPLLSSLVSKGGAYGFARVAIGPFWGYMVALCEILQNIFYVTATVIPLGEMLTLALGTPQHFEPLYWILFFVTSIYINISGQKLFWKTNFILGAVSLILLVIYILGSFGFVNFHSWATTDAGGEQDRIFDSWKWFSHLPLSVWFYIGVEMLPLAARDCKDVRINVNLFSIYFDVIYW